MFYCIKFNYINIKNQIKKYLNKKITKKKLFSFCKTFFEFFLNLFHEDRLYFWMRYSIVLFHIVWPYQSLTFWAWCWYILTGINITHVLRFDEIPKIITLRHNIKPFIGSVTIWLQTNSTFKSSTKSTSIRMCRQK